MVYTQRQSYHTTADTYYSNIDEAHEKDQKTDYEDRGN